MTSAIEDIVECETHSPLVYHGRKGKTFLKVEFKKEDEASESKLS